MKKRMHLRKKHYINKIGMIIILISILVVFSLYRLNKKTMPLIIHYGEVQAKKLSSLVISKSITNEDINNIDFENLFIINENTIDMNPVEVNRIIFNLSTKIQNNLILIEKGKIKELDFYNDLKNEYNSNFGGNGIIYEVPIGTFFSNSFFSNLGPKIPIKFSLIGNISAKLESEVKNYGINNAIVEIYIKFNLQERIIIPFKSKDITINDKLPIALKIINGSVPNYYSNPIT